MEDQDTMGQYGQETVNMFCPDVIIVDVNSINLKLAELERVLSIGE